MSRYLVDRVHAHPRIAVRSRSRVAEAHGSGHLAALTVDGPDGLDRLDAQALCILIGGEPLTAGVDSWIRTDAGGYFLTGPDARRAAGGDWPLERDPLFLESSQPGVFIAGDVRHGSIKRVASAVGEGAMAVSLLHAYLTDLQGRAR